MLLLLTTALYAQAQTEYVPLERLPGVTYTNDNVGGFVQSLFQISIGVAAFLAVIMIGIGGFQYMGGESISSKSEGRDKIVSAILGLLLLLGSFLLLNAINPSILNLSIGSVPLNLEPAKPLDTQNNNILKLDTLKKNCDEAGGTVQVNIKGGSQTCVDPKTGGVGF
ncbi:hypothetical protein A3D66_03110 [Candidatus Kaiserbacteria bacterium RIFCSPHIGHO2_02_FULL_50_9]|nr:MAG: hypothetical protein A3D66_03110 [Candidatus Kaiserbacteria bacterium RIFCSPHIGHO2_02_FULL_50_9]